MLRCDNDFPLLGSPNGGIRSQDGGSYAGRYDMLMLEAKILLATRPSQSRIVVKLWIS